MPTEFVVHIIKANNLPIMERGRNTTDAYCEVHFGKEEVRRTKTIYKDLDPLWSEFLLYEIMDSQALEGDVLEIKVIDEDVISRDDLIGSVIIDLSFMLTRKGDPEITLDGTYPIYDVDKGIRGMLSVHIKLIMHMNITGQPYS